MESDATVEPVNWPRRPHRLADAVIEALVEEIVSGTFAAHSVLPREAALCQTFQVSRSVIREAVKALEGMRLLRVQQGTGTTIRDLDEGDLLHPVVLAALVRHDAELAILEDLIDVRRALEAQMAGQAASRATEEQRQTVRARMHELDDATRSPGRFLACDVAFHDAIHVASHNRLGRAAIHTLTQEAYRSVRYVSPPTVEECRHSNFEHQTICDAVLDGDVVGAHEAMDSHIIQAWWRRRPERDAVDAAEIADRMSGPVET